MKRMSNTPRNGYTLIELMIAMALASMAVYGLFRTYMSFTQAYDVQDQVTELQQNLRAGMSDMIRHIRMAGFDPLESDNFGLDPACTSTSLLFTSDLDEDGVVDGNESFRYNFDTVDGELENVNAAPIISNVEALEFLYLDANNVVVPLAQTANILVSLVVKATNEDYSYTNTNTYRNLRNDSILGAQNDNFRREVLSVIVQCRNLGL